MDSLPPQLLIVTLSVTFILCIINTLARTASISVSDAWLKQQAKDGNKRAKKLSELLEKNSSGFMDAQEFCSVFFLIIASGFSVVILEDAVCNLISNTKFLAETSPALHIAAEIIAALIICLCYTGIFVVAPRRIASKHAERFSLSLVGYTRFISMAAKPFLFIIGILAKLISGLFGVKDEDIDDEVTEEEIRMMVDIGSENGTIDDDEKQMIHNIFEMDDKPVEDIMTHRTEACILWIEDDIDKWKEFIDETNHTRYPVCGESIDDVIGIVNSRDFYRFLLSGGKDVHSILRDVYFIPDTIKADELLSKMQHENEHMGVVMDEYGGFQGVVTQEDLIEEIVGELYSEYDEPEVEETEISAIDENTWVILGSAGIEDVEKALGIKIEEGDFNTFAGLILSELQTIPADGEIVELETNHMQIKVTSVVDHRIEKALVCVIHEANEDNEETSDKE